MARHTGGGAAGRTGAVGQERREGVLGREAGLGCALRCSGFGRPKRLMLIEKEVKENDTFSRDR